MSRWFCCCGGCESCETGTKHAQYTITLPVITTPFAGCPACLLASGTTFTMNRINYVPLYMTNFVSCSGQLNTTNDIWWCTVGTAGGCSLELAMAINGGVGIGGTQWEMYIFLGFAPPSTGNEQVWYSGLQMGAQADCDLMDFDCNNLGGGGDCVAQIPTAAVVNAI